jgi:hypothetical protein
LLSATSPGARQQGEHDGLILADRSAGRVEAEELPGVGLGPRHAPHRRDVLAGGAAAVGRRKHHPVIVGPAAGRRGPALYGVLVVHHDHVCHLVHVHRERAHLLDEVAVHVLLLRVPRRAAGASRQPR